jgi:hypothetical protein
MLNEDSPTAARRTRATRRGMALASGLAALLAAVGTSTWAAATTSGPATASPPPTVVTIGGYAVYTLAGGASIKTLGPDDEATMNGDIFVGYQNGVGSTGGPSPTGQTNSTIVEYRPNGHVVTTWSVTGKCDGLTTDPANQRVLASVNEDGNSSFYEIKVATNTITHFSYSPDPTTLGGGGTDALTVQGGVVYVIGSNPSAANAPALYSVALNRKTDVATLTSVFADNATAAGPSGPVTLALTDPDTTHVAPADSPLFAGDLVVNSQGDAQLIFVHGTGTAGQTLTQLPIGTQVDDLAWATSTTGTLYVSDNTGDRIFAITGHFKPGTVFVSTASDSGVGSLVGTLDLTTGAIHPIAIGFDNAHGMVFVPSAS